MYTYHICVYRYLCSASVYGSLARTEKHKTCRLDILDKALSRNSAFIIFAFEPSACDHKKRCRTLDSALKYAVRVSEVIFFVFAPSTGFRNAKKLETRLSKSAC